MCGYEKINAVPSAAIRSLLTKTICTTALAFVAVIACATSASAQSAPNKADASATRSTAQLEEAKRPDAKKAKKKLNPAPKPDPNPSAAAKSASPSGLQSALSAQNPLTPLYSLLNEHNTNSRMGPLYRTQNVLLIEPVIPIRLTPDFNLVTRWITPLIWQPELAPQIGPMPQIGPEFGLGNITPQFFFTPAHQGDGFVWALGANAWLPTAKNKTLGINKWGGGPTVVGLWIQGPLLIGVLAGHTWTGSESTLAGERHIDQTSIQPFIFYNLDAGWYVASLPIFTADWTAPHNKWTVPIGGGIGRVVPLGDVIVNARIDVYYNGLLDPPPGITNNGDWTAKFTMHFMLPNTKVPQLF